MKNSFKSIGMLFLLAAFMLSSCSKQEESTTDQTVVANSKASEPEAIEITIEYHPGKTASEKKAIRTYYFEKKKLIEWKHCEEYPDKEIWVVANRDSDVPIRTDNCDNKDECEIKRMANYPDCRF